MKTIINGRLHNCEINDSLFTVWGVDGDSCEWQGRVKSVSEDGIVTAVEIDDDTDTELEWVVAFN